MSHTLVSWEAIDTTLATVGFAAGLDLFTAGLVLIAAGLVLPAAGLVLLAAVLVLDAHGLGGQESVTSRHKRVSQGRERHLGCRTCPEKQLKQPIHPTQEKGRKLLSARAHSPG